MKVVYASSVERWGPLSHLRDLAPAVACAGWDVEVLCLDEQIAEGFGDLGIEAVAVPLTSRFDVRGAARAWSRLSGADVVHTHDPRTGLLLRPQAALRGVGVVHTYHGLPDELAPRVRPPSVAQPVREGSWWVGRLGRGHVPAEAVLGRLGVVVAPSRALAGYLVEHGLRRSRIRVIPYGVEVRRWDPGPSREPAVIATSAALSHRKGIDVLVRAAAKVSRPYRLEIYGDGPMREDLQALARRLGVNAVFEGFVEDVPRRLAGCDVFVLPTRGDNLPVAILEAMALALPVIGTRVGGVPELVDHERTGLLVDPDDVDGLACALARLIGDPDLCRELGKAGARKAAVEYDADAVARTMVALYEELVG